MLKFFIGWMIAVAVVYVALWADTFYYRHNVRKKFRSVLDSFSNED